MKASDVMVCNVITVRPDTLVSDIAAVLLKHRISAVPVLNDDGSLAGIVSEADLTHRVEAATERPHAWWRDFLDEKAAWAREFLKSHAVKASDVMTRSVVTATPDTPLDELASRLDKHRIKRVPIVRDGRLVGIVSRADLIKALTMPRTPAEHAEAVDDSTLHDRVVKELKTKLWASSSHINVVVHDGTVELWGGVDSDDEKRALKVAAELTPGVRAVVDHVAVGRWQYGM
jgi:CBS-domain-containing membrane protein